MKKFLARSSKSQWIEFLKVCNRNDRQTSNTNLYRKQIAQVSQNSPTNCVSNLNTAYLSLGVWLASWYNSNAFKQGPQRKTRQTSKLDRDENPAKHF